MSFPYIEFNWKKMDEECSVTKKLTNYAVVCDFGYETDCPIYQRAKKRELMQGQQISLFNLENFNGASRKENKNVGFKPLSV